MDELKIAQFTKNRAQKQSFQQFQQVMRLIIFCYKKILEEETFDLSAIHKQKKIKPEDYLKYNLAQKYLRKHKKLFPELVHLLFLYETSEYDLDKEKESFVDITVHNIRIFLNGVSKNYTDEDYYFSFECKRLKGYSKNQLYIEQGIKRYVENSYARAMPFAGMIGFIEKGDIVKIKDNINLRLLNLNDSGELETIKVLHFLKVEENFKFSYSSKHERVKNFPIVLYHLFLDYTAIVVESNIEK